MRSSDGGLDMDLGQVRTVLWMTVGAMLLGTSLAGALLVPTPEIPPICIYSDGEPTCVIPGSPTWEWSGAWTFAADGSVTSSSTSGTADYWVDCDVPWALTTDQITTAGSSAHKFRAYGNSVSAKLRVVHQHETAVHTQEWECPSGERVTTPDPPGATGDCSLQIGTIPDSQSCFFLSSGGHIHISGRALAAHVDGSGAPTGNTADCVTVLYLPCLGTTTSPFAAPAGTLVGCFMEGVSGSGGCSA